MRTDNPEAAERDRRVERDHAGGATGRPGAAQRDHRGGAAGARFRPLRGLGATATIAQYFMIPEGSIGEVTLAEGGQLHRGDLCEVRGGPQHPLPDREATAVSFSASNTETFRLRASPNFCAGLAGYELAIGEGRNRVQQNRAGTRR